VLGVRKGNKYRGSLKLEGAEAFEACPFLDEEEGTTTMTKGMREEIEEASRT